jgi:adenylate cyclase
MKATIRFKFVAVLVMWGMVSVLTALGISQAWLGEIENRTWDWRLRSVARGIKPDPKIVIVMVDQTSLEHFARYEKIYWPWPRSLYSPLLDLLHKAGAKAVAFDLLFTETSTYVDDDKEFAKAVAANLPVVSAVALRSSGDEASAAEYEVFADRQRVARSRLEPYLFASSPGRFESAALPFEELLHSSAGFGNVASRSDDDQIFRRVKTAEYVRTTPVLGLPFAMHSLLEGSEGVRDYLSEVALPDGSLLLRFYGPAGTYKTFSFHAITASWLAVTEGRAPAVPLDEFKDAYVFVGANAPGLLDLRTVPFAGNYPGVEFHATSLDNLLHRSFFRAVPNSLAVGVSIGLLGIVALTVLFLPRTQLPGALVLVGAWIGGCFGLAYAGWWMPMVVPLLGMVGVVVGTLVIQYQVEGRQHRFIRNAFQYYISAEVIDRMVADPSTLRLGGERKELTIFFSDIQGFTGISERLSPDKLVQFLNRFLSEMSSIVLEEGGTLDKYQGDAVIAFWNAPLEIKNHQAQAVRAALKCQRRLRELTFEFERDFGINVKMRIGIHTGLVSVGNFGSSKRFNYTMIGDAANVASRLEGVNKVFGTSIIASEATKSAVEGEFTWRSLGEVRVVGRKEAIPVYQPIDTIAVEGSDRLLFLHNEALGLYEREDLLAARKRFEDLGDDAVARAYIARIDAMMSGEGSFKRVWDLTEK